MMIRATLTVALAAITGSLGAAANANHCNEETVCIKANENGDRLEFMARNLKPWPITLTFEVDEEHLEPEDSATVTRTLPPNGDVSLETFTITDPAASFEYRMDWTVGEYDPDHDADYRYRLPYRSGSSYPVLQGNDSSFSHNGLERYAVDFDMPEGTPVHAARGGIVARVVEKHDRGCWEHECGQYANFIVVVHDDGTTGEYYHLQRDGAVVAEGDRVERGQHIGYSGNTGHTTMPHLHFAVYRADKWGRTQSLPVQFETDDGRLVSTPERGESYRAG